MSDDQFFIPRHELKLLIEVLRRIPGLAEELAITETRQSVIVKAGLGGARKPKKRESALPFHVGAFDAMQALTNELGTWVRLVCEQRAMEQPKLSDLVSVAKWLDRNVIALAMTEGSDEAYVGIRDCVHDCERMIDLPPEDEIIIDPQRVKAANGQVLTAPQIEKLGGRLGDLGKGLDRRRVYRLKVAKELRPSFTDRDTGTEFYRLGDVLDAHFRYARRERRS